MIVVIFRRLPARTSAAVVLAPVVVAVIMWGCLRVLGLGTSAAVGLAALVWVLFTTFVVLHVMTVTSGWFPESARLWLLTALRAAMIGVAAGGIAAALFSWPLVAAAGAGLVVTLVAALVLRRPVETETTTRSPMVSRLRSPGQVEAALRSAAIRLDDPRVQGGARTRAEIDRASALSMAAFLPDTPNSLDEATATLEAHARSPELPLGLRFYAACELVQARSLQAERTRNAFGYAEALGLQTALAQAPEAQRWWCGLALLDQGDHQLYLAREATDEGRDAVPGSVAALALFRRALHAFGPGAGYEPLLRLKIAQQTFLLTVVDPARHHSSLPHEIRDLRETRRYYRGRNRDGHEYVELALARMLLLAVDEAERVIPQLDEAEAICRALARRNAEPEIAGYLHDVEAEAARLRLELTPGLTDEQRLRLQHTRTAALRAAFLAHRQLSVADAAQAGRDWARATAETGDTRATADAYAEVARQVPVEVLRRLDAGKRATFVATQQGIATEAGYWLGAAGRPAAAVDAVEDARAILLGQRAPGVPVDAERRLRERGRADLHDAYRSAVDELDAVERALYRAEPDDAALGAIHGVRGRHDRLVREIRDLLDDVALPGSTVARTAAVDGFLVYLGAAEREGYALTVAPDETITWCRLPGAGHAEVDDLLGRYRKFLDERVLHEDELTAVLTALWAGLVRPVVTALPPGAIVTLVPLGALGLLPLHAAGAADETVDDRVVIRYAPSARMAEQARSRVDARRPVTLLAVGVQAAAGRRRLDLADLETEAVCRAYAADRSTRLVDARKDDVVAGLPAAAVWHFACHGAAEPDRPLASRLELADGPLTVREILARPSGRHRLAVLSACQSAVPDAARLDEVLGFPGALLQSGVRGVVASGWQVSDTAAYSFSRAFHEEWRGCGDPAVALSTTVRWLRTATNDELHRRFGDRFGPRPGTPERKLAAWTAQRPFAHPRHWAAFGFTGA